MRLNTYIGKTKKIKYQDSHKKFLAEQRADVPQMDWLLTGYVCAFKNLTERVFFFFVCFFVGFFSELHEVST